MKFFTFNRKKIKVISVVLIIFIISLVGIFYIYTSYFSNDKSAFAVEVAAGKSAYLRGEEVEFTVKNTGTKPIWYVVPPSRCKSEFQWSMLSGGDNSWNLAEKSAKCQIAYEDYDLIETRKIDPNESISGSWDGSLYSESLGEHIAPGGKYKIVFHYSRNAIDKGNLKAGNNLTSEDPESREFEVANEPFNDSVASEIRKNNDAKRKDNLAELKKVLESYSNEKAGSYPSSPSFSKLNDKNSDIYGILSKYVGKDRMIDPKDPDYYYGYRSDGGGFELSARFEDTDDANCENLTPSICIYTIDSRGNVSKKQYHKQDVLTIGESLDAFFANSGIFSETDKIMVITSDLVQSGEDDMIKEGNIPSDVKIVKAGNMKSSDLAAYNLVMIGTPESNSLMKEAYKSSSPADIADSVDLEKDSVKAAFRYAASPWNDQKNILFVDLGYSFGEIVRIKGILSGEKKGEFYRIVLNSGEDGAFALVQSFEQDSSSDITLNDFYGKNVELYGYKRIRNSKEFPIEESLGIMDMNTLDQFTNINK